jgi:shikimate kinase
MKSNATTKDIWSKSRTFKPLRRDPEENIALTGFMAVGKTTVGRKLAQRLGRRFVDLDKLIEKAERMKIDEIFSRKGEPYFRKVESNALAETLRQGGQVIATGGGVIMDNNNLRLLDERSFVICLTAAPEIIQRRLGSGMHRPLLSGRDVAKRIEELMQQRAANYSKARACIDTTGLTVEQVVDKIVALVAPGKLT